MNVRGGRYWTDAEIVTLREWYARKPAGQSVTDFSVAFGEAYERTPHSVRGKLAGLELSGGGVVPVSRYERWDTPPQVEGNVLIMGDCHIPYHDAQFMNRCLSLAKQWNVTQLILAGDALDARAFSHWGEDYSTSDAKVISSTLENDLLDKIGGLPQKYRGPLLEAISEAHREAGNLNEEIKESRMVLNALAGQFESILWLMGNHEAWVVKTLQKAMSAAEMSRLFMADNPRWTVSPYYYCNVKSAGEPFQIEHPKNSGKGSSKRLVPKYGQHIIMMHNHHFSVQTDPSGRWLAIEPGMCADETRVQYVQQRHSAADEHVTGAVMIRDGKPWLLNRFTDWQILEAK